MKLNKYHWIMIALTFVFTGYSIYYPLINYDNLPDRIPTHFNYLGEPDTWSNNSMGVLLMGPLINLLIQLTILPIVWWMIKVEDFRTLINGPREKIQKMSNEKVNEIQKFVISHILFITFLVAILIMTVSIGQVMVASEKAASLGYSVPIVETI
ncbi:DUF1648 domain-containing protein [uncultured Methanomethylovorans sp.]|uniref:DUF1648 domain-containing protein n=1 Tax=uncultured Methanomethylovorans sp. TaxID=183759 RepID=UPI002AA69717|nr:DUF1648 domain-containing protein [uncultured Methanomethylovorans sp.]